MKSVQPYYLILVFCTYLNKVIRLDFLFADNFLLRFKASQKRLIRQFPRRVSRFGDSAQTRVKEVQSSEMETLRGIKP